MRRPPRALHLGTLLIALAGLLLITTATAAGAHAELIESEPSAGETVTVGVDSVRLTVQGLDPEGPVSIDVTDASGDDVTVGDAEVDAGASAVQVAVEPLEVGEHIVHWHVTSEDGDGLVEGSFTFRVREAQGGGWGIWLVWLFALGVPAAIFLRPGARKGRDEA